MWPGWLGDLVLRCGRIVSLGVVCGWLLASTVVAQSVSPNVEKIDASDVRPVPLLSRDPSEFGRLLEAHAAGWCQAILPDPAVEAGSAPVTHIAAAWEPGLGVGRRASALASPIQGLDFPPLPPMGLEAGASSPSPTMTLEGLGHLDDGQALKLSSPFTEVSQALAALVKACEARLIADAQALTESQQQVLAEIRSALAKAAEEWSLATSLAAEVSSAEKRETSLKETLASGPGEASLAPAVETATAAQSALDAARQTLDQRQKELESKQQALLTRPTRKVELETELEGLRKRLAELKPLSGLAEETPDAELLNHLAGRAVRLLLRVQILRREIALQHLDATIDVVTLERDLAHRRWSEQQVLVETMRAQLTRLRQSEVQRQAAQAEADSADLPQAIRALAEHNADLIERREDLLRKIEGSESELKRLVESLESVKGNRRNLESKIEVAGMNRSIGLLMRQQIMQLPELSGLRRRMRQIEAELPPLQLMRFDFADQRNALADTRGITQKRLELLAAESGSAVSPELAAKVTEMVQSWQQLTLDLLKDLDNYIDKLTSLNVTTQELVEQTGEFRYFVEKHVLWIRSTDPLGRDDLVKTVEGVAKVAWGIQPVLLGFFDRMSWPTISPYLLPAALLLLLAWGARYGLRFSLKRAAETAAHSPGRRRAYCLRIVGLSLVLACFWPAALWIAAQLLHAVSLENPLAGHIATALFAIIPFVLFGHVVRNLSAPGGFAELYFGWPAGAAAALHRMLRWYLWTVLPTRCLGIFFDHLDNEQWASSAGRTMFIASQICLFLCLSLGLRNASPALFGTPAQRGGTLWRRSRRLWPSLLTLLPLIMAVMSLVGYHYSAHVLSSRFGWTLWLILSAVGLQSLIKQVLGIILQKISVRRFWRQQAYDPASGVGLPEEFDTVQVNAQLSRLLQSFTLVGVALATYVLWAEVLPAIQIFDRVELWSHKVQVAETVLGADGSESVQMVSRVETVTLADVGWCLVVLVLTIVFSRNLPGLLELTLLDRLPLDRGGKYAISVVCRYLVAIAGLLMAGSILGLQWSSVQWLVAAMSVGLGFGLQEIFGNFVSGIIILLERPVRMGDLVTVNGTTGWVTRVQLRATTITDFDRREMIVPNKKFITDDVTNWTLTDPITRLVIPVGIAYGSDTQLACQTLMEVARANTFVLADPEPMVVFTQFGASSLDLELRVFIPERQHVVEVQHDLHMEIDRLFRERKIEIAFPQQDVHIRSIPTAAAGGKRKSASEDMLQTDQRAA